MAKTKTTQPLHTLGVSKERRMIHCGHSASARVISFWDLTF